MVKENKAKQPKLRIGKSAAVGLLGGSVARVILFGIVGIFVVWLGFTATILRALPSPGGFELTRNITFPGGLIPQDTEIIINTRHAVSDNPGARIVQSLPRRQAVQRVQAVDDAGNDRYDEDGYPIYLPLSRLQRLPRLLPEQPIARVIVLAGPWGSVNWSPDGIVAIDGELMRARLDRQPPEFLEDMYFGLCISGNCPPGPDGEPGIGRGILFSADQVFGQPLNPSEADFVFVDNTPRDQSNDMWWLNEEEADEDTFVPEQSDLDRFAPADPNRTSSLHNN